MSTQYIHYPNNSGSGSGVTSLNGQTGALTLVAGSGITITPGLGTLTIAATGSGSGTVTSVDLSTSTAALHITGGPITTSGVIDLEIDTANSTTLGLLSAADWNTFSSKLSFIALTGDVVGEGGPSFNTTVESVGGVSAASIANAVSTLANATPNNTPNTIVLRDSNANFYGKYNVSKYTLSGTDITNGFVTLPSAPLIATITRLDVIGGIEQDYSVDFTVISNQVSWTGLGLDGILTAGDKIIVAYN